MEKVNKDIRCLHLDSDQPPLDSDRGMEFHRRCTARVPYEPEKLSDGREHLAGFCYLHRVRYAGDDIPATVSEVVQARRQALRLVTTMTMPAVPPEPEKADEPTIDEVRAAAERKRRLIAEAARHGLLDPER